MRKTQQMLAALVLVKAPRLQFWDHKYHPRSYDTMVMVTNTMMMMMMMMTNP